MLELKKTALAYPAALKDQLQPQTMLLSVIKNALTIRKYYGHVS